MGKGNTVKWPYGLDKKSFVFHSFLSRMFDWYLMSKMRVECSEFSANFVGSLCVYLPYRTIGHERENCTWKI